MISQLDTGMNAFLLGDAVIRWGQRDPVSGKESIRALIQLQKGALCKWQPCAPYPISFKSFFHSVASIIYTLKSFPLKKRCDSFYRCRTWTTGKKVTGCFILTRRVVNCKYYLICA